MIETKIFNFGILEENTYIVSNCSSNSNTGALVIDPGCISNDVIKTLNDLGGLEYIILTHAHGDHIAALMEYKKAFPDAKLVCSINEKSMIENVDLNGSLGIAGKKVEAVADIYVNDNDTIPFGDINIRMIHTPGHTKGGMCILIENTLFSGDTLFYRDVGRSDFPGGSWDELKKSIKNKLFLLPDDTVVYPGHGPKTTIGEEKESNPYV